MQQSRYQIVAIDADALLPVPLTHRMPFCAVVASAYPGSIREITMSVYYRPLPGLAFEQIMEDTPEGIFLVDSPRNDDVSQCLSDGTCRLWALDNLLGSDGNVMFVVYGGGDDSNLIQEFESHYGISIVDEFDERFHQEN